MNEAPSAQRWLVLANVVAMNFVVTGLAWTYVVVIVAPIVGDLGLGLRDWGTLWSGLSLGALLGALPAGALGDRYGVRSVVTLGALAMAGTLALRALGASFPAMLAAMVLYGVTLSVVSANLPKALGAWFPPEQLGLANGVALAGNGGGQGLAAFAAPLVLFSLGGWRGLTFVLAGAVAALALVWGTSVRDRTLPGAPAAPGGGGMLAELLAVLRIREVWLVAASYFFFLAGYLGVVSYLPTYLVQMRGLEPAQAGGVLTVVLLSYVVGSLLLPGLSDRIGLRRAVYSPGILLAGLMLFATHAVVGPALVLVAVIWGVAAGAIALVFAVPLELPRVGPAFAGSAIGATLLAGFLGGFLSPIAGLAIAERSPIGAFAFWAACYAASAFCFWLLPETGRARRVASA